MRINKKRYEYWGQWKQPLLSCWFWMEWNKTASLKELNIYDIKSKIIFGKYIIGNDSGLPSAILGLPLADRLQSLVGDTISIISPSGIEKSIKQFSLPKILCCRVFHSEVSCLHSPSAWGCQALSQSSLSRVWLMAPIFSMARPSILSSSDPGATVNCIVTASSWPTR